MTLNQLIETSAELIKKHAPKYGIKVYSPIIAQLLLESAKGTSELAVKANNFFGLKYKAGRCPTAIGIYYKDGAEQNADGTYSNSAMQWCKFASLEDCIIGYFDFINNSRYANLKGITDPKKYLETIKADGYATSLKYVDNVYKRITDYNLTKYDVIEEAKTTMGNGIIIASEAGHGSNTAGKRTPDGYREHWINVKCANYFNIAMTRCGFTVVKVAWNDTNSTDDADISLSARQAQIKAAGCKASFSWHANAYGTGTTFNSAQGIETLIHSYAARVGDSRNLANAVQKYLIQGTSQTNRKVKTGNLAMCNCEAMGTKASVLIEIGFMTNEYEANLMKTDAFCMECAEEAAQGACEYFGVPYVKPATTGVKPVTPTTTDTTYKVQSGDTLTKIGKATNIPWKDIAELNGIKAPYRLTVGQVLKLVNDVTIPLKVTQSKVEIQKFLNTYYGTEIKKVLGALLVEDGQIGTKSKLALGIAIQVELNKLGAKLTIDGKIGTNSAAAWDKFVGTLKKGSKGILVTLWQCIIVAHNVSLNGIDGDFGNGSVIGTNTLFGKIGLVKDSTVSGADINALL